MVKTGPQIDVNEYLAKMGYGGMFADPFSGDYSSDPKNAYSSAWDAYEKMIGWDPELAALDKLARMAVLAHDYEIVPATDDAESQKAADFCNEMIENISNWDDIRYDLLDSPAKGLAVVQKNIVRDGGYYTIADTDIPALQTLPQHWFYWMMKDGRVRLIFRGTYGGTPDIPIDEELFIIARHGYTAENPYGRGYLTDTFWTFVKKKIIQGYMIRQCERGVEVERWAECAADEWGDKAWDKRNDIIAALEDFGRYADLVLPPGTNLNHQPGDSGALQSELNFTHLLDNYHAKVILGQTLTTDQGRTGSYELGKIHELQQARFTVSRCKDQDADINEQLIAPICELNFNIGRAVYKTKYEPEVDRKTEAEVLKTLTEAGVEVETTRDWVPVTFDIPLPAENALPEDVVIIKKGSGGGGFGSEEPGFELAQKKNLVLANADKQALIVEKQVNRHLELVKPIVNARLREWKNRIKRARSYDDLTTRIESRDTTWREFADALRRGVVATYVLGYALGLQEMLPKIMARGEEVEAADEWEQVVERFKGKVPIDAATFYALDQELRAKFFATAVAEDEYMANVLFNLMDRAIAEEQTWAVFKEGAYEAMRKAGYEFPEPSRLKVVYQRHMATAEAAAMEEMWADPAIDELIWGFEYLRTTSMEPRLDHLKLVGTRLPKDHPFWKTCSPPNGYG